MPLTRTALSSAACLALALATAAGSAQASARRPITRPAAPVTASAFHPEPAGPGLAGGSGGALPRASTAYPPPRHHGMLRITGSLRDGGTVRAAGLSWRPGKLPAGDRLLSFEVGYYWDACTAAGQCHPGADTTAAPFAARRYVAGHADTSRLLKITETATEVVETSPATFSFSTKSVSVSTTSNRAVRAYRAGRPPVSGFVNGTPERRTASAEEYFSVAAPHYRAADGPATQRYRVDRGRWRPLPASGVFYTGTLRTGRHRVAVRTADRAGATTARFAWRVVPLPAPLPCQGHCWYPPHLDARGHPMRWDWQIGLVAPMQRTGARAVDIYDIDGFLTTPAQVRAIHTRWQAATLPHPKAICYLDLAWEDYRPDATPGRFFPAATLGNVYFGYPQERWVDFRQLDALKPMLDERIRMCAAKGFDTVELDDIDSFDPPSTTGFHLTPGDAQNYLAFAFNEIHRYGMTGLWKNSPLLSWWGRRYADGAVVEECYRYQQCFASQLRGSSQYGITCTALAGRTPCGWDDFSTDRTAAQPNGLWVGEAEYSADHYVCNPGQPCPGKRRFATFCRIVYAPPYGFSAVKFDVNLDGKMFYPCPRGT
jgi:hypothetical protein